MARELYTAEAVVTGGRALDASLPQATDPEQATSIVAEAHQVCPTRTRRAGASTWR